MTNVVAEVFETVAGDVAVVVVEVVELAHVDDEQDVVAVGPYIEVAVGLADNNRMAAVPDHGVVFAVEVAAVVAVAVVDHVM